MKIDYDRFKIGYIYVKSFEYKNLGTAERYNHEPVTGKIYRVVKDIKGNTYRMALDGTKGGSEGIIFDKLIDDNNIWAHEMVELTFENISNVALPAEEAKKVIDWMNDPEGERKFVEWAMSPPKPQKLEPQEDTSSQKVRKVDVHPEYADIMREIMNNFNVIAGGRDGIADVMVDLLNYLRTTYSDKYEVDDSPIRAKQFLYDRKHGKSVNMFCSTKYLQRYLTDGYSKSSNPMDLLKAIHYILFELARVKINVYIGQSREKTNHEDNKTTEEPSGGTTEAGDTPKKGTTRKRRKPKG